MANEYVVTTNSIEVLGAPTSANAAITTNVVEVLAAPASANAVVTTNVVEVLATPNTAAQVASMYIQVLRSVADLPFVARRRQMVLS